MLVEIVLGVVMFTAIVLLLVGVILAARSVLVESGDVTILINERRAITSLHQMTTTLMATIKVHRISCL